jgi:hypothetical protein
VPRRLSEAVAPSALLVLLLAAPQLLGGVYPWGMLALAALALAAFAALSLGEPNGGVRLDLLAIAMLVPLVFTAFQALPLPCAMAEWLAPSSVDAVRSAQRLLAAGEPRFCALSRDPGDTREEVVKGIALVCTFLTAAALSRRGQRRFVLAAFASSCVVLALVTLAHSAFDAERVFGVYEPVELRTPTLLSPLLNPNALGGLLAASVPLLIGLAFEATVARTRVLLLLCTGLVASCVFMTLSRGAVGAMFAGGAVLMVLALRRRVRSRRRAANSRRPTREQAALLLGIAAALGVTLYGWHREITSEFAGGDLSKLELIGSGSAFTLHHPWLGVGRGAFGSAFSAFHGTRSRFEYAENFIVQWIADWGFPVALLLLGALGYATVVAVRRARSFARMGALAGLLALALQNLVDLGLELAGVAVPAAALLAASVTERSRRRSPASAASPSRQRFLGLAVLAPLLAALALAWQPVQRDHTLYQEQALRAQLSLGDRAAFRATLAQALSAHPSEPLFAVLAASEALRHRDRAAGRFINRALQLVPSWPEPHLQAAEWLLAGGRLDQALLELRRAAHLDPAGSRRLLCPVAERQFDAVVALAPQPRQARAEFYRALAHCFAHGTELAERLDAVILREYPDDPAAGIRDGRRKLAAGQPQAALDAAERVLRVGEEGEPALLLKADALVALDRKPEAVEALRAAQRTAARYDLLLTREARLHADLGDRPAMKAALDRLKGLAAADTAKLTQAFFLEAQLEQNTGNPLGALHAFEQAYGITGDTNALRGIARIAETLGHRGRAAWAYGQLCGAGGDGSACARRDALNPAISPEFQDKARQPRPK